MLIENRAAATWALLVASAILFHIADRSGPRADEGFAWHWSLAPDDPFAVSYAMRAVTLGAILSVPAWIRGDAPERAFVGALALIGVLGAGSFWLLSRFYPLGFEHLDPTPLGTLFLQIVAYAALALCARAATSTPTLRNLVFKAVPLLLLLVWARHQFAPIAAPIEAE